MDRPTYQIDAANPGSDLAGESAAAIASASIVFRSQDADYADKLLAKAKPGIVNLEYELVSPADSFETPYGHQIGDGIIVDRLAESNPYWPAVRLTNHRQPVEGLDLVTGDGELVPLERKSNNVFVLEEDIGGSLTGQQDFVATDIFGQKVALDNLNITSGTGADVTTGKQFAMVS